MNKRKQESIDFADPEAVRMLNKVLLLHHYGITYWQIPKDYLCPPIPGRADHIHHAADLLSSVNHGIIPLGTNISVLDVGSGASCIYPLIGLKEYGWRFIGSEIDAVSLRSSREILTKNSIPDNIIDIRRQHDPEKIFQGIIRTDERIDLTVCNPPFHSTLEQAQAGTRRKWKNLGLSKERSGILNFGGQKNELMFPGGEERFLTLMAEESVHFAQNVLWFTTLVSKQSILPKLQHLLKQSGALDVRIISMSQGQKKSRLAAWTFLNESEQNNWVSDRWR